MAKQEKPKCSKCESTDISVATDKSNKHYCQKCGNVWVPGLEGLKREDVQLRQLKVENEELKQAIGKLREEILVLKGQGTAASEDEIFS